MQIVYNTKVGALSYSIIRDSKILLTFAKTLNPNIKPNEITKGSKVFDWNSPLYFSLDIVEAEKILMWFEANRTLENSKEDIKFIHAIDKAKEIYSFLTIKKQNGKLFILISRKNGKDTVSGSMSLNEAEFRIFLKALNFLTSIEPWLHDIHNLLTHKNNQQQSNNNNNNNNYHGNDNNNNNILQNFGTNAENVIIEHKFQNDDQKKENENFDIDIFKL